MFISILELFKIGIGPSSSHTMGPMTAGLAFRRRLQDVLLHNILPGPGTSLQLRCTLKDSLAYTGKGHCTDKAVTLGLHGYTPLQVADMGMDSLLAELYQRTDIVPAAGRKIDFFPEKDIIFDQVDSLPEHPNGMVFELSDQTGKVLLSETYFSIGGGFVSTREQIDQVVAPLHMTSAEQYPFPFDSARSMLQMASRKGLTIAAMKRRNELQELSAPELKQGLDMLWHAMEKCVRQGLAAEGILPGGIELPRRARFLHSQLLQEPDKTTLNDYLCCYAMAVSEENASGHMVVTAPTNGAAGVIASVLYYLVHHEGGTAAQVQDFLLTAAAIGGIIKHRGSISGAEVGCQGEIGAAAAMAAAGLCQVRGGTPEQIENGAEIALEHHLGMTCDPVNGLVQVPCIERNGFGAVKAYTAASLAMHGSGQHFMPLDGCIAAMKQTGMEMSDKFKETSLGGLAVSISEC
jgi:L-serine dehydratase